LIVACWINPESGEWAPTREWEKGNRLVADDDIEK
jgi:hypothetical protein